jgi:2-oxo-4-hydroxy-4-carboxy-5-ureidoimidazoline decarboxylase
MTTLSEVNAMDDEAFVAAFGGIFENSPWVARRAWNSRPFASREALHRAMTQQVESAARAEQLALLRSHPDLGARARMSAASINEQRGAGLDQLTPEEYVELTAWNQAYRDKFGFPFVFAVKDASPSSETGGHPPATGAVVPIGFLESPIMEALRRRASEADADAELAEALAQVYRIAWFRLEAAVGSEDGPEEGSR